MRDWEKKAKQAKKTLDEMKSLTQKEDFENNLDDFILQVDCAVKYMLKYGQRNKIFGFQEWIKNSVWNPKSENYSRLVQFFKTKRNIISHEASQIAMNQDIIHNPVIKLDYNNPFLLEYDVDSTKAVLSEYSSEGVRVTHVNVTRIWCFYSDQSFPEYDGNGVCDVCEEYLDLLNELISEYEKLLAKS